MLDPSQTVNERNQLRLHERILDSKTDALPNSRRRGIIVQNFVLLWLDSNINKSNDDYNNSMTQLRKIVNTIDTFTDTDQCVGFLSDIKDEKVFILVSGDIAQSIVPRIHDTSQLDSIYVFCVKKSKHEQWVKQWAKVKGIFTEIDSLCNTLKRDAQQCDRDFTSISVTSKDLNQLDPSFMYTQLLKETLIEMPHNEKEKTQLADFCREQYRDNLFELQIIDEFEHSYHLHTPIWWYTRECFTYKMLNRALRTQEVEIIIKMGFFLRDAHRQVEELHSSQMEHHGDPITVYRGQGMSNADFESIRKNQGGLLSFNNFLSTSRNENVSLAFARGALHNPDSVGILFVMTINPSISSTPFALLDNVSYYEDSEKEILFSMHTVFRIDRIKPIEDHLWQVELALSSDDDDQALKRLTKRMREETQGSTGWHRLGKLLIKIGNFDKAKEVYQILLDETPKEDENQLSHLYHMLGIVNGSKADYREALKFYQKASEIQQKYLPPNHSDLATTYNNIGFVHKSMGEYSKALEFYQKTLDIRQNSLPPNHPDLAQIYNNIGQMHENMGAYSKALDFYQKSLGIQQQSLPSNHPDLATTYNNIGMIHTNMGAYSKALDFHEKALEIKQKSLLPHHPDLATTYNNIGMVHTSMGAYSKALEFYQKGLEIQQKSLSPNHPDLATVYNNIGAVHNSMGEYSKALEFYQKALEIQQKSLSQNHPALGQTYHSIGMVHNNMGEYSKALNFYQNTLEIKQKTLPSNHPDFATSYNDIGLAHNNMGEYSKALEFYQKTLEIKQKYLPSNHPDLATVYSNIGLQYITA